MNFLSIQIISNCTICSRNNEFGFAVGEYTNNHFHELTCSNRGHKIKYFHAVPDYPIFFQNGLYAYHKKEYFEAFTSLYHSYEMFRLTFVQLVMMEKFNFSYKELIDYLKPISKSSVQIDGAFNTLYAAFFNEIAPDIPNKIKTLRNTVIHGSHYPVEKDVSKCAKAILSFINSIEQKLPLSDSYPHTLFQKLGNLRLVYLQIEKILKRSDLESGASTLMTDNSNVVGRTPIDGLTDYNKPFSFEEALTHSKARLEIFQANSKIFESIHNK